MSAPRPASRLRILSFSTEVARAGSAAEVHLMAIAQQLRALGYAVTADWGDAISSRSGDILLRHLRFPARARRHDLVYFRAHPLDLVPVLACRVTRVPYVLEINGDIDDLITSRTALRPLGGLLRAFTRLQRRWAAGVLAVSTPLAESVIAGGLDPQRVCVVPSGGALALATGRTPPEQHPPYALYFGHLATRQGLDHVLRLRHSAYWPPGLALRIAGDGPLGPAIERHAAAHGCLDFDGPLRRERLEGVLARASLTLSLQDPSERRNHVMGLPLKIAESLLLGVPVVATDLSDVRTQAGGVPGCVLVSAPSSPEALGRALSTALSLRGSVPHPDTCAAMAALSWESRGRRTSAFLASLGLTGSARRRGPDTRG